MVPPPLFFLNAGVQWLCLHGQLFCHSVPSVTLAVASLFDASQEFKGYVFKIMGGQDKQGFPMKQGVLTNGRVQVRRGMCLGWGGWGCGKVQMQPVLVRVAVCVPMHALLWT